MTIKEIREFYDSVKGTNNIVPVRVKLDDGLITNVRLAESRGGNIAAMKKGSRVRCIELQYMTKFTDKWVSITAIDTSRWCDVKLFRKHINDAIEMLSSSGLWGDILSDMRSISGLEDSVLQDYLETVSKNSYEAYCEITNTNGRFHGKLSQTHVLETLARKKCWTSIPWNSYGKENNKRALSSAIMEKSMHRVSWRGNYDYSIEVSKASDGILRGWFSAEYKGCGNGHYYLLFDDRHAIFVEDD